MKYQFYLLLLAGIIISGLVFNYFYKGYAVFRSKVQSLNDESKYIRFPASPGRAIIEVDPKYYNITNKSCVDVKVDNESVGFVVVDKNRIVLDEDSTKLYGKNITINLCGRVITKTYIPLT